MNNKKKNRANEAYPQRALSDTRHDSLTEINPVTIVSSLLTSIPPVPFPPLRSRLADVIGRGGDGGGEGDAGKGVVIGVVVAVVMVVWSG